MPRSRTSPRRAYRNSRFRVKWDGRYVAGVSKVSPLRRTTEVVEHRDGVASGLTHKAPGRTKYEAITLERGITHDRDFEQWANHTLNAEMSAEFRKDVLIELLSPAGKVVAAYKVFRCWVSEFSALPDLDAGGNAIAVESIRLENEGWQREPPLP